MELYGYPSDIDLHEDIKRVKVADLTSQHIIIFSPHVSIKGECND